jgi:ABC-type multidrug transport system ATPase subunit
LRELVRNGTTNLLTTQYLDEADRLADDIVVLDGGHIVAQGSPAC